MNFLGQIGACKIYLSKVVAFKNFAIAIVVALKGNRVSFLFVLFSVRAIKSYCISLKIFNYIGSNAEKKSMPNIKNSAKRFRATTFAIAIVEIVITI